MDDYLHPKIFLIAFAALMIVSVGVVGYFLNTGGVNHTMPIGKIMASVVIAPEIAAHDPAHAVTDPQPLSEPLHDTTHIPLTDNPPLPPISDSNPHVSEKEVVEDLNAPHEEEKETNAKTEIENSIEGLSEETPLGFLPIIRHDDGMTVFSAYKAPFTLSADTKGVVALVMMDYGLSDKSSKLALEKLPKPMTFSISPYSSNAQAKVTAARSAGQEVWMNIPIQGTDFAKNDTGPSSILSGINKNLNISRLNTSLGRATGYAGVSFSVSPDFADASPELQSVIDSIAKRGLGIAQMDFTDKKIESASMQSKVNFIQANVELDSTLQKNDILKFLGMLEQISLEKGYATASFTPSQSAFDAIDEWNKTLSAKHIQLAPLTYAIHQKNLIK